MSCAGRGKYANRGHPLEPNPLSLPMAPVGVVWPPPSTAQSPVLECRVNKAMIRSRLLSIWLYQPAYQKHEIKVSEHGVSGLRLATKHANLPWSDIKALTLARQRNQICISFSYPLFGFSHEGAYILSTDHESFSHLRTVLERFAKCAVVEDETVYWSYSKLMFWFSLFWLFDLSIILSGQHQSQWVAFWAHALKLLNHLVSFNLP